MLGGMALRNRKKTKGKLVLVREPNGRPSRVADREMTPCSPAEVRRLRDASLRGMQAPEWGTHLGRLFLEGKITAPQFEAGKRWAQLAAAARKAICAPAESAAASTFVPKQGGHEPDPDSERGKKIAADDRTTVQAMMEAHAILIAAGMLAENAVRTVCEDDRALTAHEQLLALIRGLSWIAQHWGLTQSPRLVR